MSTTLALSPWVQAPATFAPALAGDVSADVVIVGGGYCGLNTALALRERGVDVLLLEQEFCGYGASGRNAGHLTPTIGKDAPTLSLMFGREKAGALMRFADRAVKYAEGVIQRHGIACDYLPSANIIAGVHPRQEKALRKAAAAGRALGAQLTWLDDAEMRRRNLPPAFTFGVLEGCGGHLHPGKYVTALRAAALAAGVRLHERSAVAGIDERAAGGTVRVRTAAGSASAKQLVIATNAFTPVTLKRLGHRVCPVRVSLFRTPPLTGAQRARVGWDGREGIYTAHEILESYRIDGEGRIVGGSKVVNYVYGGGLAPPEQPEAFAALERAFRDRFPMLDDVPIEAFWGGWIGMTLDFLPMCASTGNVHAGVAFNGHGIAQATYMGRLLADRVLGVPNEDADLLKRHGIPIPPEPLRWLLVKALIGLFEGMDARVDRALARRPGAPAPAPAAP